MKRIKKALLLAVMILFLLPFSQKAMAQTNSHSYSSNDTVSATENSESDSTQTFNGYDTSGYYFNWKEYPDDPFTNKKIQARISSDTMVQRLKNDDEFWYVKSIEHFKKNTVRLQTDRKYRDSLAKLGLLPPDEQVFVQEQNGNAWYLQKWFINTVWLVVISIFIAAVVYFLVSNKINLFSKNAAKEKREEAVDENNVFNLNYDQLLQNYVSEKNYRFAVRILYLQLLKLLSERGLITYQPQYTNAQYLQQLQPSPLYQNFFLVTQHYEYIWYGEFVMHETSFQTVQNDFMNLKNKVVRP